MVVLNTWHVYIVECSDGTLYTGITTDVARRIDEHNSGKGAKYTASRRPVGLLASVASDNRSTASKLEAYIKRQPRHMKLTELLARKAVGAVTSDVGL